MNRNAIKQSPNASFREKRADHRHILILRVGVLEHEGGSSLCLLKNISAAGIQIRVYSKLLVGGEISIRVADEEAIRGQVIWTEKDMAGIQFLEDLDGTTLLRVQQKLMPNRRRVMPRLAVQGSTTVRCRGLTWRAQVHDISNFGARVRSPYTLSEGDRAIIEFSNLPSINAYVRWTDGVDCGLKFESPIPLEIIARWLERGVPLTA
ncbi:MAG TPA: PilZ domain-containing protein [Sphingomicrobium sp.]|nr:PilZ domain-containing protein [Sphingomicrobium sp.]